MTSLKTIARRWDIEPAERSALPFPDAIALLNVKRIELVCLLVMMSNALEVAVGHRQQALLLDFLLAPVAIALSWALRRSGSVRARQIMVAAFIVTGLVITQSAAIELAANGAISRGYTVRLLLMTLLFVLPPRTLAALLVFLTATFCAVVLSIDASDRAKLEAILGAVTVTAVAQVAGWLIYDVRRTDHRQRALIESQNARLKAQNVELDELMAITAHDLRSPLYGLRNLFDLASRRAAEEPALPARVLRDGIASLDAMIGLVTRLLQAHQADHAPLTAVVHEDLRDHVRAAAERIAPLAEVRAVAVVLDLPDDPLPARFDSGALAQILDNLLANGVRYTPAGQRLRLEAHQIGGEAILVVADSGPGIEPALRPALFRKFHRGANAQEAMGVTSGETGGKAGSGMGLFIAATYAARIDARLSFRPGEPGGAVFELALPLTARG